MNDEQDKRLEEEARRLIAASLIDNEGLDPWEYAMKHGSEEYKEYLIRFHEEWEKLLEQGIMR